MQRGWTRGTVHYYGNSFGFHNAVDGLLRQTAFRAGSGYGTECFLCLYGLSYVGIFVAVVLLEGFIFILLTVTNLREKIVDALPVTLKNAIGAGIGLFIAFLGLQNAGIIVKNDATLLSLGDITSGSALLGIIGLLVTSVLLVKRVRGALLFGILLTTLIGIPMGLTHIDGIVSTPPSIESIFSSSNGIKSSRRKWLLSYSLSCLSICSIRLERWLE